MSYQSQSRRALVRAAWRAAAAAFVARAAAGCASLSPDAQGGRQPSLPGDPFTLGVASGSPGPDSVVLWTRLAPAPSAIDGGMPPVPVRLRWEIAQDPDFRQISRSGEIDALPARAHAVHVRASGLSAGRRYWYRFKTRDAGTGYTSPTGRTLTAAGPGQSPESLRIAVAGCQHYERGHFAALRHLADEDPDLLVFVGDYIYESNLKSPPVRRHWSPVPFDLDGYRLRYAQYRTDPDLQRAHAIAPWLLTWDDHEVVNDYANDRAPDLDPNFLARRAAAYLAYFEHMPVDPSRIPDGPDMQIYQRHAFGDLASLTMLDCRQYRSHQACPKPGRGGSNTVVDCAELADPNRTMLGFEQERWLARELRESRTRWNLLVQSTLFSRFDSMPGPGERYWTDGWSGYPAAADRMVRELRASGARNPVILGGDVHAHYVCDVKADFSRPDSPTVATEFCVTSITSPSMSQSRIYAAMQENPHILLGDGRRRGYLMLRLGRERCEASLRVITDPRDAQAGVSTLASFVVADGKPGARRTG